MSEPIGSTSERGIFRFVIDPDSDAQVTARAGLPLILEALRALRLDDEINTGLRIAHRRRGFSELDKIEALVLLLAAGGERVEDIRILSDDRGLLRLLERELPSPDALLEFLHRFHDPAMWNERPADAVSFVPRESAPLVALDGVLRASVHRIAAAAMSDTATIDHDGTIIESHRQGTQIAYDGTRGYQPLVSVWAEQDLIVAEEFRDGNVPAGKDPLPSVQRAFEALPEQVVHRYFRGDSADYCEPLLKYLVAHRIGFAIGADMSESLRARCEAVPARKWKHFETRASEQVHTAEIEFCPGDWPKNAAPLRYVALRFVPRQESLFEPPPRRFLAVVSNRTDLSMKKLVRWYFGKAGTIEQVHRVFKDELGAAVLPSKRFGANAAWFRINALTYNLLSLLRRCALPGRLQRARPKRLRFEVFTMPGRITLHQRQLTIRITADPDRTRDLIAARSALLALRNTHPPAGSRAKPASARSPGAGRARRSS